MTKQMSPLRQRMIDDMTIRNMSPSTHQDLRSRGGEVQPPSTDDRPTS